MKDMPTRTTATAGTTTLDVLLKHGASPNGVPGKGWTSPLAAAIEGSCSKETIQLLYRYGAEAYPKDLSLVSLEALLKAGADPNTAEDRNPPLLHASQQILRKQGDTAMCLLLQYGVDPLRSVKDGFSTQNSVREIGPFSPFWKGE